MKSFRLIALSALMTVGTFSTVVYTSCTKDECKGVTCQNGGTCSGGTCTCPSGVGGANCETIYRTGYTNTYKGNGTAGTFTFTNYRMVFTTVGTDLTQMNLALQDASGGSVDVPILPITLANNATSGSTFTITSTSTTSGGITYTYTGNGSVSGTTASMSLTETPSTGAAVVYTFTNMIKQ